MQGFIHLLNASKCHVNTSFPDCLTFYLMSIYPLENFESRPQIERDLQIGKIQWIVNQIMTKRIYHSRYEDAVEVYMKKHPKLSYEDLLRKTDFSEFKSY